MRILNTLINYEVEEIYSDCKIIGIISYDTKVIEIECHIYIDDILVSDADYLNGKYQFNINDFSKSSIIYSRVQEFVNTILNTNWNDNN